MTTRVTHDFETKSWADLTKVGSWAYSEHPTTEVICLRYKIGDGPNQAWWPGKNETDAMPKDLYMAVMLGYQFEAHNIAFEFPIWANVMMGRYGWTTMPLLHQWRDSMAVACYYALPAALDKLSRLLGMGGKDPEGARLITKYSKLYLKTAKEVIPPEDFQKFLNYCGDDVEQEEALSNWLGDLPDREIQPFLLDLEINVRGMFLDLAGIEAASEIVEKRSKDLVAKFRKLTGLNPTQIKKVKEWFAKQGLELENMQADYLEELMEEGDVPAGPAREAMVLRLQINKASLKKLSSMARQCGKDGRARFQTRYHGAMTGRNTGSGFQPLNLNRGFDKMDPEQLVGDIMHRDPKFLDMMYGDAMDAIAKASRHFIMAEKGNRIISGDIVSIEAVILACLAGEQWKIDAFTRGVGIYDLMACKIHNLGEEALAIANDPGNEARDLFKSRWPAERQDGKTGELAFGYQGALGAWLKFDSSGRHSDERIIQICKDWRREHPRTTQFWRDLETAALEAVRNPGTVTYANDVGFEMVDEWLSMIGLDGKRIWYFAPQIRMAMPQWHKPKQFEDCRTKTCDCKPRPQLTYVAQKMGKVMRVSTYGGKIAENATQFHARQILVPAALRLRDAGYHPILTVYDEVVCEDKIGFGSAEEFAAIMKACPGEWAAGWPINVDVWEGSRYKK